MAHFLTDDDECRDLIRDDIARSDPADGYRFGRTPGKRERVHARNALRHVTGYFSTMIEAIANSKLRRMERELELRGIRFDRSSESWVTGKSHPAER